MMRKQLSSAIILGLALSSGATYAACPVTHSQLENALKGAQSQKNGGFGLEMWGSVVNRAGIVCAVARTGNNVGDQWPGSRVISAQKANTANAFSLPGFALSTANLYSATQPGGTLFGLQESNPVNVAAAYAGNFITYGSAFDPLVNQKIGGVNVFGGGLALYNAKGTLVGAIGVSGDSSCADHNIAWKARFALGLDHVPAGPGTNGDDNIVYDIVNGDASPVTEVPALGKSAKGWGHPTCGNPDPANQDDAKTIAEAFKKAGSGTL